MHFFISSIAGYNRIIARPETAIMTSRENAKSCRTNAKQRPDRTRVISTSIFTVNAGTQAVVKAKNSNAPRAGSATKLLNKRNTTILKFTTDFYMPIVFNNSKTNFRYDFIVQNRSTGLSFRARRGSQSEHSGRAPFCLLRAVCVTLASDRRANTRAQYTQQQF